ncbi:glycerophosphodiester phosphodiesterase, partial [Pseudoflavonifractor sp. BIOML-A4]|nr:glycerophosphodiester phosphodiesterase [Pseudoflavonifractor sp. BIOML-A4]
SKVQMVQFGIDNASLTELMGAIKDAKLVGYANHLDWDSDLLNSKYSHLQTFIDNKIEVVQTDYSDLVNSYLKEKGLR